MPFLDNDGVTRLTTDYLDVFARKEDAILDPSGGLIRTDDGISVDSLTRESDGAISGSIVELTAEGHAEQASTTGKNLLPHVSLGEISNNGVTFTSYGNGTYRLYGTATGGANLIYALPQGVTLPSGELYVHMRNESIADNGIAFYVRTAQYSGNVLDAGFANENRIVQIVGGSTITHIAAYVSTGKTVDITFTPSIELTDTLTDYEPYTGGAPSPSPDYPQEIKVVRGRNLLSNVATSQTINGVTFTVNADGSVTVNGTASSIAALTITDNANPVSLEEGSTYTLSGCPSGGSSSTYELAITNTSSGGSVYRHDYGNGATFTSELDVNRGIQIIVRSGTTVSNITFYPQLVKGSTPQPYVPYGHVGMEVQGKNLLNLTTNVRKTGSFSNATVRSNIDGNGVWIGITSTNYYASVNVSEFVIADNSVSYKSSNIGYGIGVEVSVSPSTTYALSAEMTNGVFEVGSYDASGNFLGKLSIVDGAITTKETCAYIVVIMRALSNGTTATFANPQLKLGSTATEYEPYYHTTTPIPLPQRGWVAGLPDGTADTLRIDGAGKVQWTLPTNEVVLDGTESWYSVGNTGTSGWGGTNTAAFYAYINRMQEGSYNSLRMYSDRLIARSSGSGTDIEGVGHANNYLYVRVARTLLATYGSTNASVEENATAFKAWLAAATPTVLYPLTTPVTEDCGYVDMPSIPGDCTVSIPELDALGVKYFVDDSAGTLAKQWYERADSESDASIDQRIELVESNIAMIESTTAQSNHAVNSYFMLDNVLRKATSAIASGETISNSNSSPITVEQVVTALNNSVAALEKEVVFAITPSVSHRNIYRGKNLGTALTTAQKAQIAAGTFDDLYVGDYWTINGRVYRIADINYYYNVGDTAFTKHHLVIVPDASFGNSAMNDSDTTTGAYVGSKMYTSSDSALNTARTTISNDFGSSLASHREYLPNTVDSNGAQSAGAWCDSIAELMNEPMVYGCFIHTKPTSDTGHLHTIDKAQLALFRLNPVMVNLRYNYWLRDVVSSSSFTSVFNRGNANYNLASSTGLGVRPVFCIVGD